MSYVTGVALAIVAVIIVISALVQVSQYRHGRQLISGRQLTLRLVMAVLLLSIIGLSFWGVVYFNVWDQPLTEIIFWLMLMLIAVVVVVLAVVDLRQVRRAQHLARAELYKRMAQLQREMKTIAEDKQVDDNTSNSK